MPERVIEGFRIRCWDVSDEVVVDSLYSGLDDDSFYHAMSNYMACCKSKRVSRGTMTRFHGENISTIFRYDDRGIE